MKTPFNPLDFGFVKLGLQHGSLSFYEYRSGDFCDGTLKPHRLNLYLTQDGEFVTVWHGLFDAAFVDQAFHDLLKQVGHRDFDFAGTYNVALFRGYIETQDEATLILKAVRYTGFSPSILRIDAENCICCDPL